MSDFFAGINNIQRPQVVMNQGPLPGLGGLPAPLHQSADARINYNSSLLGDITPYAYGEPGFLSSQTAYLNIPHRIQKVIPSLWLPEPADTTNFRLCHPVDEGDLAFVMRLNRNSEVCTGMTNKTLQRAGLGTAIDPFINLTTLNYILAGLQICTLVPQVRAKWDTLMHHLDASKFSGRPDQVYDLDSIIHIVQNLIRPFGIVHGKDNQGGQSEATLSSVQWPVNFVTNMILDGKDANIVNIWHNHDISAGDDLVLRLKVMPLPPGNKYTLNHYRKGFVEKTFPPGLIDAASAVNSNNVNFQFKNLVNEDLNANNKAFHAGSFKITHVWQLVPDVFSLDLDKEMSSVEDDLESFEKSRLGLNHFFWQNGVVIPWQHQGYWHIVRTQVQSKKYGDCEYYYNDMALNLRLGHIDSTFQPTFCAYPYVLGFLKNAVGVAVGEYGGLEKYNDKRKEILMKRSVDKGKEGVSYVRNIDPIDKYAGGELVDSMAPMFVSNAGNIHPSILNLEQDLDNHEHFTSSSSKRKIEMSEREESSKVQRVPVHASLLAQLSSSNPHLSHPISHLNQQSIPEKNVGASTSLSPVHEEDIGVFDSPITTPAPAPYNEAVPTFTVAKPGLKSAKKPRGKGVVSSVLGVDGSIRQEQSRML